MSKVTSIGSGISTDPSNTLDRDRVSYEWWLGVNGAAKDVNPEAALNKHLEIDTITPSKIAIVSVL